MENKIGRGWGRLVEMCLETASASAENTEKWKSQQSALDRLPFPLGNSLMQRLIQQKLLSPSLLRGFKNSVEEIDLSRYSGINEEWLEILGTFPYISTLKLADCIAVNDSSLSHIYGWRMLKELDLSRCDKVTDTSMKKLVYNQNLEKLYVPHTKLTGDGVIVLSCLSNLILLDLGGIPVTDKALSSLQGLTKLEHLDVRSSKISNKGVHILESFPRLSFLNIACTKVTFLPYLPSLETLNMSHCTIKSLFHHPLRYKTNPPLSKLVFSWTNFKNLESNFTIFATPSYVTFLDLSGATQMRNLKFLEHMKNLEHLDLGFVRTTTNMMRSVAKVGFKLKYLNLRNTLVCVHGLMVLDGLAPNLEYLSLASANIDDKALYYLRNMTKLKTLDLSNTKICGFYSSLSNTTVYALNNLINMSQLESLNLEDASYIRNNGLHPISKLVSLKSLYLGSADLIFQGNLHDLPLNPNLKLLRFCSYELNDSNLSTFNPPKSLNILDLRRCSNLKESSTLDSFCRKHPQIEIIHEMNTSATGEKKKVKNQNKICIM